MLSTSLLILDVDLDHLAQVVFVRFLHLKITLSISYSWRHVVIPWGWCIYINHLEFFFMQNLFYAFTYSFQHMCVCGVCVGVCVHVPTQLYPTLCDPMKCGQPGSSLSMGFPRQEYWSGLPFPTPGELSNPGIKPASPASPTVAGRFFTSEPSGKPHVSV